MALTDCIEDTPSLSTENQNTSVVDGLRRQTTLFTADSREYRQAQPLLSAIGDHAKQAAQSLTRYAWHTVKKHGVFAPDSRPVKAYERRQHDQYKALRDSGYGSLSATILHGVTPDIADEVEEDAAEVAAHLGVGSLPAKDLSAICETIGIDEERTSKAHVYRTEPLGIASKLGYGAMASGVLEASSQNPEMGMAYFGGLAAAQAAQMGVRRWYRQRGQHTPSLVAWMRTPVGMAQGLALFASYSFRHNDEEASRQETQASYTTKPVNEI